MATNLAQSTVGFWLGGLSLQHGGVGLYARRTLHALLTKREADWRFSLLCHADAQASAASLIEEFQDFAEIQLIPDAPLAKSNWRQRFRKTRGHLDASLDARADVLAHQDYLSEWVDKLPLDLIHFPTPTPPYPAGHVPYKVPALLRMTRPFILTVHDVQELRFPEYFSAAQRAIRAMHHWEALDKARKVIVSYDHVKADLIKYFALPEDKIDVCPIAYQSIHLQEPTGDAILAYELKYGKKSPYLLYPAQTWRHKNHALLLRALRKVRERDRPDLQLICTGRRNEFYTEIEREVEALSLGDAVFFTDVVPEDELVWLYRNAALVVIPTEYEAGSYPLLEAMLLGVPVICSNVTSLPETIEDKRFLFDPYDEDALAALIQSMLTSEHLRGENMANGLRQTKKLRSFDAAACFYKTYRSTLSSTNPER
jgi:glycosyltransferase involved in cell wall biosynthesis